MTDIRTIAVTGNKYFMPSDFPLTRAENAGNMIHGIAPMEIFPDALHAGDPRRPWGKSGFVEWADSNATHLIFSLANTIRLSLKDAPPRDYSFIDGIRRSLEKVPNPALVVFGLGSQAPTRDLAELTAPQEVVSLMQYLGDRCEVVGVRGQFTADVFEHFAGVTNTVVTGCPSTFSRPKAIEKLFESRARIGAGKFAYSGTSYRRQAEREMLLDAMRAKAFLIEPQSKENHQFYVDVMLREAEPAVPGYLLSDIRAGNVSVDEFSDYVARYYRLFRSRSEWDNFNAEFVSFTYGTRFHVNMAALLSGIPALWVTHDSRTAELAEFLRLPSIELSEVRGKSPEDLAALTDYDDFFEHIESRFENFDTYLRTFGLAGPKLKL